MINDISDTETIIRNYINLKIEERNELFEEEFEEEFLW